MTPDGSRIAGCNAANIYWAYWNGTNYTAFVRTLDTNTETNFIGIAISYDGSCLFYNSNGILYQALWSSSANNYLNGVAILNHGYNLSGLRTTTNNQVLYGMQYNNPSAGVIYTVYNGFSYGLMQIIPSTAIPFGLSLYSWQCPTFSVSYNGDTVYAGYFSGGSAPIYQTNVPTYLSTNNPLVPSSTLQVTMNGPSTNNLTINLYNYYCYIPF